MLLDNLLDWLRIPSISTGGGDPADMHRAAEFVCSRVRAAGGSAGIVVDDLGGSPIAVGELRAADPKAPTVLIYGHYDVQGVGDPDAWITPPFEPDLRGGRIYARGAADDKGNFLPLLHAACALAAAGELAVHVRVVVEGEEEVGGAAVERWLERDTRGADCAIVFDAAMEDVHTPAITIGLRGMVGLWLTVRAQPRDLHSGLYGGVTLNAVHVLHRLLAEVLPGPSGVLRDELREGVEPPSQAELDSWADLRPAREALEEVAAREVAPGAADAWRERTGADASLDVNWIEAGAQRTVVPAQARAFLTLRLAPRQEPERLRATLERLLREALPPGAELEIESVTAEPALFDNGLPAIRLAQRAIERATGMRCALVRTGGSIPIVAALARKGMPVIVSGFGTAEDEIHAPNESYRLESLELGDRAGRELLRALAALPRAGA
ncbi:MAG: M20/M25/M40 family metallo-hydrolase [Solirubrobacteraceae bacterium]|nr:M20/M25/M40 family metallo-hydrolase [Solirubrobacteraceae bacterium]